VLALMDALIAAQTAVSPPSRSDWFLLYHEHMKTGRSPGDVHLRATTIPAALICFGRPGKTLQVHGSRSTPGSSSTRTATAFHAEELDEMYLPFGRRSFEYHEFP